MTCTMHLLAGRLPDAPAQVTKSVLVMALGEIKSELERQNDFISTLVEIKEIGDLMELGNLSIDKELKEEAKAKLVDVYRPGSDYAYLNELLGRVAKTPKDRRAARLGSLLGLFTVALADSEQVRLQSEVEKAYNTSQIKTSEGILRIGRATALLAVSDNSELKKEMYEGLASLNEVEAAWHKQIRRLNAVAIGGDNKRSEFKNYFQLQAAFNEISPSSLEERMKHFVEGTKDTYNKLMREIISSKPISAWEEPFLVETKDPFHKLGVPVETGNLLDRAIRILEKAGYDLNFMHQFLNPQSGALLDLEEREEKGSGAYASGLGSRSPDIACLYYNPVTYSTKARARWKVFPHELTHVLDFHHSRKKVSGEDIFFYASASDSETSTALQEKFAWSEEILTEDFKVTGTDLTYFYKYNLLGELQSIYKNIKIALGELLSYEQDSENSRLYFAEADKLTSSDIIIPESVNPCPIPAHHLFILPGTYHSYFTAALNGIALASFLKSEGGSLLTPRTAEFMINNIF